MKKWAGVALALGACVLFVVLNQGAYRSFFTDDELDNLTWAPRLSLARYAVGLLSPLFQTNNFRPAGHFYFYLLGNAAHLYFPPYIAVLQGLHLLNASLVWVLARRLGLERWPSGMAVVFFVLNFAAFDAFWKPMYCFDVLCTTFCLTCVIFYIGRNWIACFVAFWLAYKSKELAIMLPLVLAAYEFFLGDRRWKRLVPYFVVSLSFGVQAMIWNPNRNNDYTFRLTMHALEKTVPFYSTRLLLAPFAGLIFLLLPFVVRDRRIWFALAWMSAFFLPLLFLPGRVFEAYVYLPEVGAAIAVADTLARVRPWLALLFFVLWIPWVARDGRIKRNDALAEAARVRTYYATVATYAVANPHPAPLLFTNRPENFRFWGIRAIVFLIWKGAASQPEWSGSPEGKALLQSGRYTNLVWDNPRSRLLIQTP